MTDSDYSAREKSRAALAIKIVAHEVIAAAVGFFILTIGLVLYFRVNYAFAQGSPWQNAPPAFSGAVFWGSVVFICVAALTAGAAASKFSSWEGFLGVCSFAATVSVTSALLGLIGYRQMYIDMTSGALVVQKVSASIGGAIQGIAASIPVVVLASIGARLASAGGVHDDA